MAKTAHPLKLRERVGYGLGDTASNFFFQTFNIFLLYYYTDVYGISAAAVGTMFFVSRLWDAVNDPLMGAIADRTRTRFGRFRPYLLTIAIPYGLMGFLLFANPDFDETGKLIYAWITYTLMMMLYTAINVPYSALMGVMSPSSRERTVLASFRFVGAFGGALLISMLVRPMVQFFGAEDEATGFRVTMAIFAVISILMFWTTFATTRERVTSPPDEKINLKNDLRILFSMGPWLVLFFAGILTLASVALRTSVTIHYFKYYVLDDGSALFWIFDQTTLFLSINALFLIIGVCCTRYLTERFEKRSLLIWLSLGSAIFFCLMFFVPPDQFLMMLLVSSIGSLFAGPTAPLVWSMYGDVADYSEWRFNRRMNGLIFSACMFAQKFGLTIGAGLSGWLLAWFGYVANVPQTESAMTGIRLLFTFIPAAFAILNVIVLTQYRLSDAQVDRIEADLINRKLAQAGQ
ncbi:MAG: MFS transporter [Wenzhouxiangella sp.]|nr:MAG: MFS transporter [Wenzhouxiangella sp.]